MSSPSAPVPHPLRVAIVCGNPRPGSRTLAAARAVADVVTVHLGDAGASEPEVVDLAEHAGALFDWSSARVKGLVTAVCGCDIAIVASPTFKATYTGLLKAFLDWFGQTAMAGVVAIPVMVGGAPQHALAPEVFLRPLLVEIGAAVPTRGLFLLESQLEDLGPVIDAWLESAGPVLARLFPRG